MEYTLKRVVRSRSIKIRLDGDGQVVVSAPQFVSVREIDHFVIKSEPWIEQQTRRLKLKQTANPSLNWDEGIISYLGQLYYLRFDKNPEKVRFEKGICYVSPVTLDQKDVKKTLVTWMKHRAEADISKRTLAWANVMGVKFANVSFGQQISRWGSCSGDNNLRFNWRLIHFPPEVIDYVVIHELAHTVHHNHSDRFWGLVVQHCPRCQDHRNFLKRQTIALE